MASKKNEFYEKKLQETLSAILVASKNVAVDEGIVGFTMKTIAKKAHLSRQRLYFYFKNIDEILYEIQIEDTKAFISKMGKSFNALKNVEGMIDLGKFFDEAFLYGEENYKDFLFTSIFDNYFRNKIGDKKRHDEYLALFDRTDYIKACGDVLKKGQDTEIFRKDINLKELLLFWLNTLQTSLQRIALLMSNEEKHSKEEFLIYRDTYKKAFFRFLFVNN